MVSPGSLFPTSGKTTSVMLSRKVYLTNKASRIFVCAVAGGRPLVPQTCFLHPNQIQNGLPGNLCGNCVVYVEAHGFQWLGVRFIFRDVRLCFQVYWIAFVILVT